MPKIARTTASCALAAVLSVATSPAFAVDLQAGQWQSSEAGTENGKPVPPKSETSCMTPDDAKNPMKGFSPEKGMQGQCKTLNVKQSPAGITMHLICGDPKQFSMDIAVDYKFNSPRSYTGTVKSAVTVMGKTTTSDKTIDGKWVSTTCKK